MNFYNKRFRHLQLLGLVLILLLPLWADNNRHPSMDENDQFHKIEILKRLINNAENEKELLSILESTEISGLSSPELEHYLNDINFNKHPELHRFPERIKNKILNKRHFNSHKNNPINISKMFDGVPDFQVNEENYPSTFNQNYPDIGRDNNGNSVVVWEDSRDGNQSIYAQRFNNMGNRIGQNFRVSNDSISAFQSNPSIAVAGDGSFVITWYNSRWDIYAQRYDTNGNAVGANFLVNDDGSGASQYRPSIGIAGNGSFVITWYDSRNGDFDIYAQRYDINGNVVGVNFLVNDDGGGASQYYPSIAVAGNGSFVITWYDYRNGDRDIYAQRYHYNGNPVVGNFLVNDDGSGASQYRPSIGIAGNGSFVITWYDNRNGNNDIYAQRYDSNGIKVGVNFQVNDDVLPVPQYYPSVGVAGDGSFVITWLDPRNGAYESDIYAQRYDSNGTKVGVNFQVNDDGLGANQNHPSVGVGGDDSFVITWSDFRNGNMDIYAQHYGANGLAAGINIKVNDDAFGANQYWSSIGVAGDGSFIITWYDGRNGDYDIYAQRYDTNGIAVGTNFRVNDDLSDENQDCNSIAVAVDGSFIIAWFDYRNEEADIYAKRYDSNGTAVDTNFLVNDDGSGTWQDYPSIGVAGDGSFVITWHDNRNGDYDIYAQRYDTNGDKIGMNFLVNDDGSVTRQDYPSIGVAGDGSYVITWSDYRFGDRDIYAQRYDSIGNIVGVNFLVNDDGINASQYDPSIAVAGDGSFVITWNDNRNGDDDIYAQRYDSNGNIAGVNFLVNDDGVSVFHQHNPSIAVAGDGSFVITWNDGLYGYSNNADIFMQKYDENGIPHGGNIKVNNNLDNSGQVYPAIALDSQKNIYIAWMDNRILGQGWDIFAKYGDWNSNFYFQNPTISEISLNPDPPVYNESLTINANITAVTSIKSVTLNYAKSDGSGLQSTPMGNNSDSTYQTTISSNVIDEHYLKFWIDIEDDFGYINLPDTIYKPVMIPQGEITKATVNNQWYMFSLPYITSEKSIDSVLANLGTENETTWKIYRTKESVPVGNAQYYNLSELRNKGSFGRFELGNAFWLYIKNANSNTLDFPQLQTLKGDSVFSITLNPGWNQIANPFIFPIDWLKHSNANENPNIKGPIKWDGNQYIGIGQTDGDSTQFTELLPWDGYFVYNAATSNQILTIDPSHSTTINKPITINNPLMLNNGWKINFTVRSGSNKDNYNYIGASAEASDLEDKYDLPELPVIGDYVSLFFDHELQNGRIYPYTIDYKSYSDEGHIWTMRIKSNINNKQNILEWIPENIPEEFEIALLDITHNTEVDIDKNSYNFKNQYEQHPVKFKVFVGTEDFVNRELSKEKNKLPNKFHLSQNYPNPFNSSTTIGYSLARQSKVTLEIFNILGKKIKTLLSNQVYDSGRHKVSWDGSNNTGKSVSSGVYFYRIRTEKYVKSKKMALLR